MVNTVLDRLKSLRLRNENNSLAVNKYLYRLLLNKELLTISYNIIKSKPGNMTPGTDNETLDGISNKLIDTIIGELRTQKFEFKPVRRVYIPKSNGKLRPLGVPSPRDKLVQQAMLLILEPIYEPIFSDYSHGFRPGRSCHTALKEIRKSWSGSKWAIEGDIKGCYDNVDHHVLIKILKTKIQDERFIQLIWKLLRSGTIINNKYFSNKLGTPQGGILSPLLANIYLNELDKFVSYIITLLNSKSTRRPNPEYKRLESRIWRLRQKISQSTLNPSDEIIELIYLQKERFTIPSKNPVDTKYVRIKYIRYADDWIIGVTSEKRLATEIRLIITSFLKNELKLTLSPEKTQITYFSSRKVKFLGYLIQIGQSSNLTTTSGQKRRSAGWQPRLFIPVDDLINKLSEKNFCKNGKGIKKKGWILYPDEIITKRYNSILLGLKNYYSPADNYRTSINRIQYILKFSWAHTLATKHRTRISKQLVRSKELGLKIESNITNNIWDFKINMKDPYIGFKVSPLRTKLLSSDHCKICGSKDNLEMHHIKALKKDGVLIEDRYMAALMQRMNRKQLCVCTSCHNNIHKGEYDWISLKFI